MRSLIDTVSFCCACIIEYLLRFYGHMAISEAGARLLWDAASDNAMQNSFI
jgi:hypothetical protein